jgi:tetratricopeptide (TPR) repeat protein
VKFLLLGCSLLVLSCASVTSAQEYYSLGMAYYNQGKYAEAEGWFKRAATNSRTMHASRYQLGVIAYQMGRFDEARQDFETVLKDDENNTQVLKAAAYSCIRQGDFDAASGYYQRVLSLEPDSADSGYNYALVLMAMKKPADAEAELLKFQDQTRGNQDALLLLARVQAAQQKVEAIDNFAAWLDKAGSSDDVNQVRFEYGEALENGQFYARAVEQYKQVLTALPKEAASSQPAAKAQASSQQASSQQASGTSMSETSASETPTTSPSTPVEEKPALTRGAVYFALGRCYLLADSKGDDWTINLHHAVAAGFSDKKALAALVDLEPLKGNLPKGAADTIAHIAMESAEDATKALAALEKKSGPAETPAAGTKK